MIRVLFDTNIYGNLLREPDAKQIEESIRKEKDFIVYNFPLIRQEIRNIPKVSKASRKTRILLLQMYDCITERAFLEKFYCNYFISHEIF